MDKINKKKFAIILVAILVVIAFIIGGFYLAESDKDSEPTLDEIVASKLAAYQTDIDDSLDSLTNDEAVADYLMNWAKNKKIKAARDVNGNVIYTIKADKEYKDAPPTVIICGYDSSNMAEYSEPLAIALTTAKNAVNHGKFKVIFTHEETVSTSGSKKLSTKHFKDNTNLFYIGKSGSAKVTANTGGYYTFRLSDKLNYKKPDFDRAYRISIKNLPSHVMGSKINNTPNAIKQLGSILANFKSTSLPFEMSMINGGDEVNTIPSSATMKIIVSSSDEEKFLGRIESAKENFTEKYGDSFPEAEFICEEIEAPTKVITKEKTENILSLLYTAPNGVYEKDDDGNVIAITNIGTISTKDDMLQINVATSGCDQAIIDEIKESYEIISGLAEVNYKCTSKSPIFAELEKNTAILESFESAFSEFTGDSKMKIEDAVEFTPLTFLREKNDKMQMLYLGTTEKTKEKFAGSLITFLDNGKEI